MGMEEVKTCYLRVIGMSNINCINRIQDNLLKVEGVVDVVVILLIEKVEVKYSPKHVTPSQISNFIHQLGFGAHVLENEVIKGAGDHIETVELFIEGMTCASCVYKVERESKKIKGVLEASVTLLTNRGVFKYDNSTGVGTRDIINR